jgi:hypothetical protein
MLHEALNVTQGLERNVLKFSVVAQRNSKGEPGLKLSKKLLLVPVAALMLLVAAAFALGAQTKPGINIPPGEIVDSPNAQVASDRPEKPVPAAPSLPEGNRAGASTVVETFDGAALDAWQGVGEGPTSWVARDGRLQQSLPITEHPTEDVSLFVTRDAQFANGTVETYFYPTGGSPLGVVVRGSTAGYYRVVLNMNQPNESSKAWIELVTGAGSKRIAAAPVSAYAGYNIESWQYLKVSVQGNTISVSVDGREILTATDTTYTQGWAGLRTLADRATQFDNVRIQREAAR